MVVCLHPAIDRTIEVESLERSEVVRGKRLLLEAAGKGINVAHTLAGLGRALTVTGFLGKGEAGFFARSFTSRRVTRRFVSVAAATRESVTIVEKETGREIHIIDSPMKIEATEVARLRLRLAGMVRPGDTAIFSGSCPRGVNASGFSDFLRLCLARGANVAVDTNGAPLRAAVRAGVWLVKPNTEELAEVTGRRIATRSQRLAAARSLLERCEMVLVSLGGDGAMLVTRRGAWQAMDTRRVKVVHTVGCGDALLAGFVGARAAGKGDEDALRYGVACGSACVRSLYACIRSRREAEAILPRIRCAAL